MTIHADNQSLSPGALVELFELRAPASLALQPFRFCNFSAIGGGGPRLAGQEYTPLPIEADGFEFSGKQMPRPSLRAGNVDGALTALVREYDDLVGWSLVRHRTYAHYLDGGAASGSPSLFPDDLYFIEQKVSEDDLQIEWELVSALDLEGLKLPTRTITVYCSWVYRGPECGYTGPMYDRFNDPTDNVLADICNKQLTGCRCRHGQYAELPFGGFPGVRRFSL